MEENTLKKFTTAKFISFAIGFFGLQFAWQTLFASTGKIFLHGLKYNKNKLFSSLINVRTQHIKKNHPVCVRWVCFLHPNGLF